jgi:PAS domain-containing protein
LDANQRRQVGFTALMVMVFGLGAAGMAVVAWRRRNAMTQAYEALLGEVGERRAAQEAQRTNTGRFHSLVQRACDLTVVTDESGVIRYVGPAAEARVAVSNPSHVVRPGSLMGTCVSTRPGMITMAPASINVAPCDRSLTWHTVIAVKRPSRPIAAPRPPTDHG